MKPIKALYQLQKQLDADLSWRKKELFAFKLLLDEGSAEPAVLNYLIRAGLLLLYAHWEGFVKSASSYYLSYVVEKNQRLNEIKDNFIAIHLKKCFPGELPSRKVINLIKIVKFMRSDLGDTFVVNPERIIETESNLSAEVLAEIICTLGLDYAYYETKQVLINRKLVFWRNNIAHGQYLEVDYEEFAELYGSVIEMINEFKSQIETAATEKGFTISTNRKQISI